jgi:hypothetical protein
MDKMKLSQVCEQSATRYYGTEFTEFDRQTDFYSSHYNQEKLECLILVHEGAGIDAIFDPIEHKHVASRVISSGGVSYIDSPFASSATSQSEIWFNDLMKK